MINRSPRNPRARAELARALAGLLAGDRGGAALARRLSAGRRESPAAFAGPVHVPERKLEDATPRTAPLPGAVVDPLVQAVRAVSERQIDSARRNPGQP